MKTNLAMMAFVSLAISACSSTPKISTEQTPPQHAATNIGQVGAAAETSPVSSADISSSNMAAQLQEMQQKSVYFDFGEYTVKPEYSELIQQQAEFIKAYARTVVTLEGNTDERGSSEYNLALGDKRANAVRKSLEMMGVSDSQIKIVSLGEEHPRLTCHEEQCWKENRRVDFSVKQGSQ